MNEKNPQALAVAYRRAVAKSAKLNELEITAKMEDDAVDAAIKFLAEKKAESEGKPWTEFVKGQRWYVEDLVKFAGLDAQERLNYEYAQAFPDTATEDELLTALEKMM